MKNRIIQWLIAWLQRYGQFDNSFMCCCQSCCYSLGHTEDTSCEFYNWDL